MRWVGWFAKLVATIITVSLLTVMTTGYVVNSYIQSLLGSYNIPVTGKAPTFGGMMKGMFGFSGGEDSKAEADKAPVADSEVTRTEGNGAVGTTGTDSGGASGNATGNGSGEGSVTNSTGSADDSGGSNETGSRANGQNEASGSNKAGGSQTDTGSTRNPTDNSVPVMGGVESTESGQSALGQDQQVVVSPDDLKAKKDELPDKEKEEVFAILMNKLPQEDMETMTAALEGGLTEEEMINIEQILSKHLDENEYEKVMEILKK